MVVFYNGAVDRSLAPDARVFQRSTWAGDINAHCLYVCDPSLYRDPDGGPIGWGQVDESRWAGNLYTPIIQAAGELLGIPPERRVHYGSSAGGYQALVTATVDKGSRALVNNPQTDWLQYSMKSAVSTTLNRIAPGVTPEVAAKTLSTRTRIWSWFRENDYVPRFTYLVNTASPSDLKVMMPPLRANLVQLQRRLKTATWDVHYYTNSKQKHNPLSREVTVAWLNKMLRDLNYSDFA